MCPNQAARRVTALKKKSTVIGGRTGYADVLKSGSFAWENKAPGKNLINALRQL